MGFLGKDVKFFLIGFVFVNGLCCVMVGRELLDKIGDLFDGLVIFLFFWVVLFFCFVSLDCIFFLSFVVVFFFLIFLSSFFEGRFGIGDVLLEVLVGDLIFEFGI